MFDWDDEELTNMIWGDDGEKGDHIVPFKVRSEQLKKKGESKQTEEKITATKIDLHDNELGSSSGHNVDEGIPQPSSFALESGSAFLALDSDDESEKCNSTRGEKSSELGKGPDIFHSTTGDFDDYSWATIGSFDDLDRMFSNDVPIFGDGSLSGADELWSNNNPSKSLPSILDSQDLGLDIRTEFEQQEDHQFPSTGQASGPSSQSVPNVCVPLKAEKYHKGQTSVEDQQYQQSKMMKFSKPSGTSEAGAFQDLYGQRNSPGKIVNQLARSRSSLMAINLQSESQGSGTSHYHPHMPDQYMATSGFGNLTNPYSTVPLLSTVQCPDVKNQLMHPSYNPATTISANMATDASARPSTMTPQEKLEKLRRRQQMQAMLAIRRQHQQFRQQVPVADQSITQKLIDKSNLQRLTAMPSFDPNSSVELDDSGNFPDAVDNSAQFSVLYRLQEVVAKMDTGIRTCIRDSLFRLAGSAAKRHHTAHSNKTSQEEQEVIPRYRYAGMPDTETVTNPTDRTVAHLLFHRPFEMSAAKHMEGPESSTRESRLNKQKPQEEGPAGTGNPPNSGSSSAVGETVVEGNKRKL